MNPGKKSVFHFASACVIFAIIVLTNVSQAGGNIWELLEHEGDALDLMAIEAIGDRVLLLGARYEEQRWQADQDASEREISGPIVRKQMHIISINSKEQIEWQHSYPAIPDVNEIYSASTTNNGHLCIAFGRNYNDEEFINPVVLQVDAKGKIIWADFKAIPESSLPDASAQVYLQIANLESIRVVDTPDNGCLLGYILRSESPGSESLQLNLVMINKDGDAKWHFKRETELYGKMFLLRNADTGSYVVVQTNQSRDAAIQAMMAGQPFAPRTNMLVISLDGKLKKFYDLDALDELKKVWIKNATNATGGNVLLAGNAKNAWAALISENGKLEKINNTLVGEFTYVGKKQSGGYILVRSGSTVALDDHLTLQLDQPIEKFIKKKYVNPYLAKQLSDKGPIQNIVPTTKNSYLILYKLASRLQRIELPD